MKEVILPAIVMVSAPLVPFAGSVNARQQTEVLPVGVFIDALPVTALALWIDPASGDTLVIDAYGKRDAFFGLNVGTSITGQVTVKDLGDGTQRVTLNVHTKNAICWGFNASGCSALHRVPCSMKHSRAACSKVRKGH